MLTGRRAFEGESQSKVIAVVLEHDPPPLTGIRPSLPAALARIVQKCLAKDPERRWQSAGDLADELKWIVDRDTEAAPVPAASPRWRRAIPVALVVGLAVTITSAVGGSWRRRHRLPSSLASRSRLEKARVRPPVGPARRHLA